MDCNRAYKVLQLSAVFALLLCLTSCGESDGGSDGGSEEKHYKLAGYYRFEDVDTGVKDETDNHNDGTNVGAIVRVEGYSGYCFSYAGEGEYAEIPDSPDFDITEDITIDVWVYPADTSGILPVVGKWGPGEYSYRLYLEEGIVTFELSTDGAEAGYTLASGNPVEALAWTRITAVRKGDIVSLYLNAESEGEGTYGEALFSGGANLIVGGYGDSWVGKIDELKIYREAVFPEPDTEAPCAVGDLSAGTPGVSRVRLTWTAPGDDGNEGRAFIYDMRISESPINDSNFSSCTQIGSLPDPSLSGSEETVILTGLEPGTAYYAAVKSADENGNLSGLSNIAQFSTHPPLTAPVMISAKRSDTEEGIETEWSSGGNSDVFYHLYRAVPEGEYSKIWITADLSCTDLLAEPETAYMYKVCAADCFGEEGSFSNEVGYRPDFTDSDNDGMDDQWELDHGLDPDNPDDADGDPDGDHLSNYEEYCAGTDPSNADTDGDGLKDGVETAGGTDPLTPDSEDIDSDEILNKYDSDNDNDGIPDEWEVQNSLNPLDPSDASLDPDGDFLINKYEYEKQSNPHNGDTDADGVIDGYDELPCKEDIIIENELRRVESVAGSENGSIGDGIPPSEAVLGKIAGICVTNDRKVFIADRELNSVRVIDLPRNKIYTVVGSGGAAGYAGDGVQASQALVCSPSDVAVRDSVCVIADSGNHRIRAVNLNIEKRTVHGTVIGPGEIATIAGTGSPGYEQLDTQALETELNNPWGLAYDDEGNLYIAEQGSHIIRRIDVSGVVALIAGKGGTQGYSGGGGDPLASLLNSPQGIEYADGNLYVADTGNHIVRKINVSENTIRTCAGIPEQSGLAGDGRKGTEALLNSPQDAACSVYGEVYISTKHTVRVLYPDGRIMRYAGGVPGIPDSSIPLGLAIGGGGIGLSCTGDLFFAENSTARVIRIPYISDRTYITKKAGLFQGAQPDGDNTLAGNPAHETFAAAHDMDTDPCTGETVYSDTQVNRVRRINTGGPVSVIEDITSDGQFSGIGEIEVMHRGEGTVYIVADTEAYTISAVNTTDTEQTVFGRSVPAGGCAVIAGSGSDTPGPFFESRFHPKVQDSLIPGIHPKSMAYGYIYDESEGRDRDVLYITSAHQGEGNLILKLTDDGMITSVAGGGDIEQYDSTWYVNFRMGDNVAITLDAANNIIYAADPEAHVVFKCGWDHTIFGSRVCGYYGQGGYEEGKNLGAIDAHLLFPEDISYSDGRIIIVDSGNLRVRVIEEGYIRTVGGTGTAGMTNMHGLGLEGMMNQDMRVQACTSGVLVSDMTNCCISCISNHADSDGDGLTDTVEAALGTNPESADTDGDGLSDYEEVAEYGTSPAENDTDGDGLTDSEEVRGGSDARDSSDIWRDTDGDFDDDGIDDSIDDDADNDGIPDEEDGDIYSGSILSVEYEGRLISSGDTHEYGTAPADLNREVRVTLSNPIGRISVYGDGTKLYYQDPETEGWTETVAGTTKEIRFRIKLPDSFHSEPELDTTFTYSVDIQAVWENSLGSVSADSHSFSASVFIEGSDENSGGNQDPQPGDMHEYMVPDRGSYTFVFGCNEIYYGGTDDYELYYDSGHIHYAWELYGDQRTEWQDLYNAKIQQAEDALANEDDQNAKVTLAGFPGTPDTLELDTNMMEYFLLWGDQHYISYHNWIYHKDSDGWYRVITSHELDSRFKTILVDHIGDWDPDDPEGYIVYSKTFGEADTQPLETPVPYNLHGLSGAVQSSVLLFTGTMDVTCEQAGGNTYTIEITSDIRDTLYNVYSRAGGTCGKPECMLYIPESAESKNIPFDREHPTEEEVLEYSGTLSNISLSQGTNTLYLVLKNDAEDVYSEPILIDVDDTGAPDVNYSHSWQSGSSQRLGVLSMGCPMNLECIGSMSFSVTGSTTRTIGPGSGNGFLITDNVDKYEKNLSPDIYIYKRPWGVRINRCPESITGDPDGVEKDACGFVIGDAWDLFLLNENQSRLGTWASWSTYRGHFEEENDGSFDLKECIFPVREYRVRMDTDDNEFPAALFIVCEEGCAGSSAPGSGAEDGYVSPVVKVDASGGTSSSFIPVYSSDDSDISGTCVKVVPGFTLSAFYSKGPFGGGRIRQTGKCPVPELISRTEISGTEIPRPVPSGEAAYTGHGIVAATGEFMETCTDLTVPGRGMDVHITRTYCSQNYARSGMGMNWDFNYNKRLYIDAYTGDGEDVWYYSGYGRKYRFSDPAEVSENPGFYEYTSPAGVSLKLVRKPDNSYAVKSPSGIQYMFPAEHGGNPYFLRISRVRDLNGNVITFEYNSKGRLNRIVDTLGRDIDIVYDLAGNIRAVQDFSGRSVTYTYHVYGEEEGGTDIGCEGDLASVTFRGTEEEKMFRRVGYEYSTDGTRFLKHNLTRIKRYTSGTEYTVMLENEYDAQDRVCGQKTPGSGLSAEIVYSDGFTRFTDRNGSVTEYLFNSAAHDTLASAVVQKNAEVEGTVQDLAIVYEYNASNLCVSDIVYPDGQAVNYQYCSGETDPRRKSDVKQITVQAGTPDTGISNRHSSVCTVYEYNYETDTAAEYTRLVKTTDSRGNEWKTEYDEWGNPLRTLPPACARGTVEWGEVTYNLRGQPVNVKVYAGTEPGSGGTLMRDTDIYYFAANASSYDSGSDGTGADRTGEDSEGSFAGREVTTVYRPDGQEEYIVHRDLDKLGRTVKGYGPMNNAVTLDLNPAGEPESVEDGYLDADAVFKRNTAGELIETTRDYKTGIQGYVNMEIGSGIRTTAQYTDRGELKTARLWGTGSRENTVRTFGREGELKQAALPGSEPAVYEYTPQYLLKKITRGNTEVTRTYTKAGNVRKIETGGGHTVNFLYDGLARLRKVVFTSGRYAEFEYDEAGNCTKKYTGTPNGTDFFQSVFTYDEAGRLFRTETSGSDTGTETADILFSGFAETITDNYSNATVITRDGLGRIVSELSPEGVKTEYTYDGRSRVTRMKRTEPVPSGQPEVRIADIEYPDAYSAQVSRYKEGGSMSLRTSHLHFDSEGNLLKSIDPEGNTVWSEPDEAGRIITRRRESGNTALPGAGAGPSITTKIDLDAYGNLKSESDANGNITQYVYDSRNRVIQRINPDGTQRTLTYMPDGMVHTVTTEGGSVITNTYDSENRLDSRDISRGTGIEGTTHEDFEYDILGRIKSTHDDNGGSTAVNRAFTYSGAGDVLTETQSAAGAPARVMGFEWYDDSALKGMTYPSGTDVTVTRDAFRRPQAYSVTSGFGQDDISADMVTYSYTGTGRVAARSTFSSGIETVREKFEYNDFGETRSVQYTFPLIPGQVHGYAYTRDNTGNIISRTTVHTIEGRPGRMEIFQYDDLYRLTSYTSGAGLSISWTLDKEGNWLQETRNNNILTHVYNSMNERTSHNGTPVFHTDDGCFKSKDGKDLYTYDYKGRMVSSFTMEKTSCTDPENMYGTEVTADSEDPSTPVSLITDKTTVDSILPGHCFRSDFTYSEHWIEVEFRDGFGGKREREFNYVDVWFPTSLGKVGGFRLQYKDCLGNYSTINQSDVIESGKFTFGTDGETVIPGVNSLTGLPCHYISIELAGSLHAVSVTYLQPAESGPEKNPFIIALNEIDIGLKKAHTATYAYGTDNIRVKAVVDGRETEYVTSGGRVLEEYEVVNTERMLSARYLYGNGLDEPVAMERDLDLSGSFEGDELFFYLRDAQGNITGLTDCDGEILERYDYTPYGKVKILDKAGNIKYNQQTGEPMKVSEYENPYLFQSRRLDPWSGRYYFRNRYYDPETGRFLSRDPARDDSLGNLYAFVNNNPVNAVDPWGLEEVSYDQLLSGFMKSASADEIGQLLLYLSEGNKITVGDVWLDPDYDDGCGWASSCDIQIEEDKGIGEAVKQLKWGLKEAVKEGKSRSFVKLKRVAKIINGLYQAHSKWMKLRRNTENAIKYKETADLILKEYFGNKKKLEIIKNLNSFVSKVKTFVKLVKKYKSKTLDRIDKFYELRESINHRFNDIVKIPGENSIYKLTGNSSYKKFSKWLNKLDKNIGRIVIVTNIFDILHTMKDCEDPENQMEALEKVWKFSSRFGLNKVCPKYGKYVTGCIQEISKGVTEIKWKLVENNVDVAIRTGLSYPYMKISDLMGLK